MASDQKKPGQRLLAVHESTARPCIRVSLYTQSCHFSGISGNLEMSGNWVKVGATARSGKKAPKSGKSEGICVIREI